MMLYGKNIANAEEAGDIRNEIKTNMVWDIGNLRSIDEPFFVSKSSTIAYHLQYLPAQVLEF